MTDINTNIGSLNGQPVDLNQYRAHVSHLGLSPEREDELLVTVWRIMSSFVDAAFHDDPAQHVHETLSNDAMRRRIMVGSRHKKAGLSGAFIKPAVGRGGKKRS